MKKHISAILILITFIIIGIFFANVNSVLAGDCSCYKDECGSSVQDVGGTSNQCAYTVPGPNDTFTGGDSCNTSETRYGDYCTNPKPTISCSCRVEPDYANTCTYVESSDSGNGDCNRIRYTGSKTGYGVCLNYNSGVSLSNLPSCDPTCSDGIKNQDETGVDVGGVCTPPRIIDFDFSVNKFSLTYPESITLSWDANKEGTGGKGTANWSGKNGSGIWTSRTGLGTWIGKIKSNFDFGTWKEGTGPETWTGGPNSGTWEGKRESAGTWTSDTGSGTWNTVSGTGNGSTGGTWTNGTWDSYDGGRNGAWANGTESGVWKTTVGAGGAGDATWTTTPSDSGTWKTTADFTSCVNNWDNNLSTFGSSTITPTKQKLYKIQCTGPTKTETKTSLVQVTNEQPSPICDYKNNLQFLNTVTDECITGNECESLNEKNTMDIKRCVGLCNGKDANGNQLVFSNYKCVKKNETPENNPSFLKTGIYVDTLDVDPTKTTTTTAVLKGEGGGLEENPTSPYIGYFRYSKAVISPIFCNDIYGTNMVSTKDISLKGIAGKTIETSIPAKSSTNSDNIWANFMNLFTGFSYTEFLYVKPFSQEITGLTPNTKYYYCAIVSNNKAIGLGGNNSIVKSFTTSPLETRVTTKDATRITATTATLNGSFISTKNVKTYFEYQENILLNSTY